MFCTSCGAQIHEGYSFCVRCGKPVVSVPSRPYAPSQLPQEQQSIPARQGSRSQARYVVQQVGSPMPAAGLPVAVSMSPAIIGNQGNRSQAEPDPETDHYCYDETSVLPEHWDDDLETIVQPEPEPECPARSEFRHAGREEAADVRLPSSSKQDVIRESNSSDAVRLQPMTAPGALPGDDSETVVLTGGAPAEAASERKPPHVRSLQLTRSNGDRCVLSSFPVTVGKGFEADLIIDDNGAVSRLHVRLLSADGMFAAEDLGSTNKTFIGEYELPPHTPTVLSDGDTLKLGNEVLKVRIV